MPDQTLDAAPHQQDTALNKTYSLPKTVSEGVNLNAVTSSSAPVNNAVQGVPDKPKKPSSVKKEIVLAENKKAVPEKKVALSKGGDIDKKKVGIEKKKMTKTALEKSSAVKSQEKIIPDKDYKKIKPIREVDVNAVKLTPEKKQKKSVVKEAKSLVTAQHDEKASHDESEKYSKVIPGELVLQEPQKDNNGQPDNIPPREIYIVEKITLPEALLVTEKELVSEVVVNDKRQVEPEVINNEYHKKVEKIEKIEKYEAEKNFPKEDVVTSKHNETIVSEGVISSDVKKNIMSPLDLEQGDKVSQYVEKENNNKSSAMEAELEAQVDEAFVFIKQGDKVEKIPATKVNVDGLKASLDAALLLNWGMITPSKEQKNDQRFSYCYRVLEGMRRKNYVVYSPYSVSADDYDRWQQKLGEISLVQLLGQSLNFYQLKGRGDNTVNVVETVFETDTKLSEMLLGVKKNNYYFSGVLSFGENSQQSLGGVGRFHGKAMLNRFSWFLIEWDAHFYALRLHKKTNGYSLMEIIPLLYQQQKNQRNCRWKNRSY